MAAKPQYSESPQQFRERLELPYNRIGWAFEERPDLDSSARFVLLVLAFKPREGGASTLAVETICNLTRYSRPTVRAALKRLVLAGLIVATGKSPGRWTNKYQLALAPYDLKMPTPGERGPVPKRFPQTKGKAAVRVKNVPVQPAQPESSLSVEANEPESSFPRESRRLRKDKKKGLPPLIQAPERPASADAPAATANGAPAPSVRSNSNHPSKGRHVMDDFDAAFERDRKHPPISPAAVELSGYLTRGTGRPLPGSWLYYSGLRREVDRRNFLEVGSVLVGILERTGGGLPEPEAFFRSYGQYRQVHLAISSHRRNGRRRRAA